jgi:hypothetical protein
MKLLIMQFSPSSCDSIHPINLEEDTTDMMGRWLFCYSHSTPTVFYTRQRWLWLLNYRYLGSFICYIGAAMSLKSVFNTPFKERLAAYNSKLTWADSSCSDCVSFLNAYKVCISHTHMHARARKVAVSRPDEVNF